MDSPSKPSTSRENTRRRKYTSWTIQKKLEALEMMDAGVPTGEIALEYRVNDTTVRRWAYERKKLKSHCDLSRAKRIRVSPVEEVNAALTTWYHAERRKNNAVTVTQLKVKAQQFFKTFGGTETFAASDGWLQNWKRKNGIRFLTPTKDQLTADTETVTEFKEEILQYIEAEELSLSQIFNVGETGLFYKMLPKKALTTGSRNIQDRLTVMMCCNADGSFQLPLLLIGKSKKPRALKNLATHLLPAKYTHETNTWMSAAIFESWFKGDFVPEVVNFLKSKNLPQKAILLLENVSSHPLISELKVGEIRAIFFPPNVTSLIQPLDQGIIEDMKNRYITNLLTYIINAQEDGLNYIEAMDSFSLKNAIELISDAWDQITHQRISNCWNKLLNVPIKEDNSDDIRNK
ncbi:PREDICTED: jerky protein homolog-like [Dufourea novaeangliae]|uniref:jerky protein homolog-like n=1 Tax=Dufourea novaeangliae TaxID=178035 RepID=UPI0007671E3B|nr:PREDICTED: jerky protein homolog-like [Dufourea novaeangliae]